MECDKDDKACNTGGCKPDASFLVFWALAAFVIYMIVAHGS